MGHLLNSAAKSCQIGKRVNGFATLFLGVNFAALSHDFTRVVTGAIGDGIVGHVLPSASIASSSGDEFCLNFITTQVAADLMSALILMALGVMLKAQVMGFSMRQGERLSG
jgi:hypothetical protein